MGFEEAGVIGGELLRVPGNDYCSSFQGNVDLIAESLEPLDQD